MKFVCMKCESFMSFNNVQTPGEQSLGVTFTCPTCEMQVAMVTNAGETAMVKSLGVQLGGRTAPATPMELTRSSLKETPEIAETEAAPSATAQQALLKAETEKTEQGEGGGCPFSSMVAQMGGMGTGETEKTAPATVSWSEAAESRLEGVPSFMRPMIKMGVESYAQKNGISAITPEVMDASKNDPGDIRWSKGAEARLENIPSFVRPMAKKEIERIAKERGETEITDKMMEESKEKFMGMGY